jgi:hypothetical protein
MIWEEKSSTKTIHLVFMVRLISTGSSHRQLLQGINTKAALRLKGVLSKENSLIGT